MGKRRPEDRLIELGKRIQQLREAAGKSQSELSSAIEVPVQTLRNWEQGRREPGVVALEAIAEALDVEAGELLKPVDPDLPTQPMRPGRKPSRSQEQTDGAGQGEANQGAEEQPTSEPGAGKGEGKPRKRKEG